jgi:hypothetical protein
MGCLPIPKAIHLDVMPTRRRRGLWRPRFFSPIDTVPLLPFGLAGPFRQARPLNGAHSLPGFGDIAAISEWRDADCIGCHEPTCGLFFRNAVSVPHSASLSSLVYSLAVNKVLT